MERCHWVKSEQQGFDIWRVCVCAEVINGGVIHDNVHK